MGKFLIWLFLGLAVMTAMPSAATAQGTDYFGRKSPPPASTNKDASKESGNLFQRVTTQIALWQSDFRIWITGQIHAYKSGATWAPALMIILISFLYGVFHAVGPGHGKVITTSYFAANRAEIGHGLLMGGLIAVVQAISAIALVGIFALVLNFAALEIVNPLTGEGHVIWVEVVSYGLMVLVGLWLLWGAVVGRGCSHAHHGHGDGDRHDHEHDHAHGHGHGHAPPPATPSGWAMVPAAVAAGLRPCSGAVLVLLFTLANGIFLIGVISTFAMGIGVAITISLIGIITILIRRGLANTIKPGVAAANVAHRAAGIVGGVVVVGAGVLFLYAAAQRTGLLA